MRCPCTVSGIVTTRGIFNATRPADAAVAESTGSDSNSTMIAIAGAVAGVALLVGGAAGVHLKKKRSAGTGRGGAHVHASQSVYSTQSAMSIQSGSSIADMEQFMSNASIAQGYY